MYIYICFQTLEQLSSKNKNGEAFPLFMLIKPISEGFLGKVASIYS